jgi:hypothetical protein
MKHIYITSNLKKIHESKSSISPDANQILPTKPPLSSASGSPLYPHDVRSTVPHTSHQITDVNRFPWVLLHVARRRQCEGRKGIGRAYPFDGAFRPVMLINHQSVRSYFVPRMPDTRIRLLLVDNLQNTRFTLFWRYEQFRGLCWYSITFSVDGCQVECPRISSSKARRGPTYRPSSHAHL